MTIEEMYDYLIDVVGVSEDAVNLVVNINGFNETTMKDILYAETGYTSFEQFKEEFDEFFEEVEK